MSISDLEKQALEARSAQVLVGNDEAGILQMVASDEYIFTYSQSYLARQGRPISLAMPLQTQPYVSETLHPFFDNLLFEGEQLRLAEKRYGMSRRSYVDRFKLLMVSGYSNLSNISVIPIIGGRPRDLTDEVPFNTDSETKFIPLKSAYTNYCSICLKTIDSTSHKSCRRSLWSTVSNIKLEGYKKDPINIFRTIVPGQSISGAQRKALFSLQKRVLFRKGNATHILKPSGDYPEMPANEHLTMTIAKELRFPAPSIGLYQADEIGLIYVIRRFEQGNKALFTEDMAQLSQELAEDKDYGSLEGVAEIIRKYTTSPKVELSDFFRRVVFCFLTGNGDMHLKNWSLSQDPNTNLIKLSPVYDLLNVRMSFPQEQVESILTVDDKQNDLTRSTFFKFGKDSLELPESYVNKVLSDTKNWLKTVNIYCERSALSPERKKTYMDIVEKRYSKLQED